MKLDKKTETKVRSDNEQVLMKQAPPAGKTPPEWYVLEFLAQMFDLIAKDTNMYVVIGSTQDRTSFSFSIKGDLGATGVYGVSLAEIGLGLKQYL